MKVGEVCLRSFYHLQPGGRLQPMPLQCAGLYAIPTESDESRV